MVGVLLHLRMAVGHGHPESRFRQHLDVVERITEGHHVVQRQSQRADHVADAAHLGPFGGQQVRRILVPAHRAEPPMVQDARGLDARQLAFLEADDQLVDRAARLMGLIHGMVAHDWDQSRMEGWRHRDHRHVGTLGIAHRHALPHEIGGDALQVRLGERVVGDDLLPVQIELAVDGDEVLDPRPCDDRLQRRRKDVARPPGGDGRNHPAPFQPQEGLLDTRRQQARILAVERVVNVEEDDPDTVLQCFAHACVSWRQPLGWPRTGPDAAPSLRIRLF